MQDRKKCMEYEVEGPRPRERPKRTWREVVKENCQARKLNTEVAMDRSKWRKLIKDVDDQDGCEWVNFFWYRPTRVVPDQRLLNGCVCVCVCVCRTERVRENVTSGTGSRPQQIYVPRAPTSLQHIRHLGWLSTAHCRDQQTYTQTTLHL